MVGPRDRMTAGGPVVAGYDGSRTARRALERAAEVAAALEAELHVVAVVTETIAKSAADGPIVMAVDAAETLLSETENELSDRFGHTLIVVTKAVPAVSAGDALLRYTEAADAQLLVVGNQRVRGFRRFLGSVPDDVAVNAPCDVLIVKTS